MINNLYKINVVLLYDLPAPYILIAVFNLAAQYF